MTQDKYTRSARGKHCQVRIPGVCNGNPETVVFAHLNGGGMGAKRLSIHGAYACSACHDVLDGRVDAGLSKPVKALWHYEGVIRTQEIMVRDGVLEL